MPRPVEKIFTLPRAAQILLAANLFALGFVLTLQYGFGLRPCILCLWQRVPYGAAAALAALIWGWRPYGRRSAGLLTLCAGLYLASMGIAIFHSGVEQHWWAGTSSCGIQPLHGSSSEDLRESLLHTIAPRCDQIAWKFLGLSLSNWNIVASLALAFFATIAGARMRNFRAKNS